MMPHVPQDDDFANLFLHPNQDAKNEPTITEEQRLELLGEEPHPAGPADPKPSGAVTKSNFLRHPETHPIILDMWMTKRFGAEWLDWEPETIEIQTENACKCDLSHLNLSKLQALKAMHLVDSYWQQWEVFMWCTMPLNDIPPDFEIMQVPTVAQCMVSVDIADQVRDDVEWSEELRRYLEVVHRHDGIMVPQAPLDFVHVDTDGYPLDAGSIQARWPKVRDSETPPGDSTADDCQLSLMLEAYQHLLEHRGRLQQQLKAVLNA